MNRRSILKLGLLGLAAIGAPLKTLGDEPKPEPKMAPPKLIRPKIRMSGEIVNKVIDRPGCELWLTAPFRMQHCKVRCASLVLEGDHGLLTHSVFTYAG